MKKLAKCILLNNIQNIGEIEDKVNIAPGYARYLQRKDKVCIISCKSDYKSIIEKKINNVVKTNKDIILKIKEINMQFNTNNKKQLYDSIKPSKILLYIGKKYLINTRYLKCKINNSNEIIKVIGNYTIQIYYKQEYIHQINLNIEEKKI